MHRRNRFCDKLSGLQASTVLPRCLDACTNVPGRVVTPSGLDGLKYGLALALVVLSRISWLSHGCVALLSCIAEAQQYVLQLQAGYTPTVQEASHPSKSSADPQSRSELLSSGNRSMHQEDIDQTMLVQDCCKSSLPTGISTILPDWRAE